MPATVNATRSAALALAAAAFTAWLASGAAAQGGGCAERATQAWTPVPGQPALTIEAFSDGPTCADATATFVIRDADGAPVWADAFVAAHNFMLRDATSSAEMADALRRWIDPAEMNMHSTAALPGWAPDANNPGEEFPFVPSEVYRYREDYEALRADDLPLLCIVSGGESILCLVHGDGWIEEVGHQSFPG